MEKENVLGNTHLPNDDRLLVVDTIVVNSKTFRTCLAVATEAKSPTPINKDRYTELTLLLLVTLSSKLTTAGLCNVCNCNFYVLHLFEDHTQKWKCLTCLKRYGIIVIFQI